MTDMDQVLTIAESGIDRQIKNHWSQHEKWCWEICTAVCPGDRVSIKQTGSQNVKWTSSCKNVDLGDSNISITSVKKDGKPFARLVYDNETGQEQIFYEVKE